YERALTDISRALHTFGFRVIPVPGLYHKDLGLANVNFMNSIIGVGKNGKFCITNGSSHSLDRYLREAYTAILHAHGIDNVYFVGRETTGEYGCRDPRGIFDAAETSLSHGGGIHCRTQEVTTSLKGFAITPNPALSPLSDRQEQGYVGDTFQQFLVEMVRG
ncbi:MAG: hypothetical protein JSR46_05925, partial [Verrucomicrobia bacterium]|nr:hypothetical protein [Verrucomicrobiota bacterium]